MPTFNYINAPFKNCRASEVFCMLAELEQVKTKHSVAYTPTHLVAN